MSFTQPTPPPASGGCSRHSATPAAAPVAPAPATSTPAAAPAPEDKILLFSGRAARSNSVSSKDAAAAAAAVQSSTEGSDGEKATILIASGRRRSRAGSISGPAAAATAAAEGATTEGGDAWGAVKPTVVAAPWGADPAVWNGGSTTTTPAPAPPAPAGGFVDPWAKPGASSTTAKPADPWAATPAATPAPFSSPSNTNSGFTPPSFGGYGTRRGSIVECGMAWFNSANNSILDLEGQPDIEFGDQTVRVPDGVLDNKQQNGRVAAQTPSTPTTPETQRPTLPGGGEVEGGKEPFVYSEDVEKGGSGDEAGGHQTLAVHEVISVRRSNVLRTRADDDLERRDGFYISG
ncbi:hypothetical protein BC829DRAFT_390949 [Chytridium lagenaria]|nr:hypothetical protein BC829DRAFT_390949 [Chytridium lagenaria]